MINVQELFWSLAEYGKDYVSGHDPIPEFNGKLNEAQRVAFDWLSPEYDKNERVRLLLEPFTRLTTEVSDANGIITPPVGFHRLLGGRYTQGTSRWPIYYSKENEIDESDFIPQRKADLSKGIAYFTYVNGTIVLKPNTSITLDMHWLSRPPDAKLVYDYNVSQAQYVQLDAVNTVNLQWSYDAYELLLNILLLKYSLISRDQFKAEIGNLGLNLDKMNA